MAADADLLDRGAYLPGADALVCADLHLGRDASANVEFPLGERERVPDRLAALLDRVDPAEVVVAGDLLHAFDRLPAGTVDAIEAIREAVAAAGAELVVTPGNHDARLDAAFDGPAPEEHRLSDGTVVCHGHDLPEADADRYVIGHDHPAIEIEGRRRPCYLYGPATGRDAEVLVLPAFNALSPGVLVNDARGSDLRSPLVGDLARFRPAVRDPEADETFWFPPLASLRSML